MNGDKLPWVPARLAPLCGPYDVTTQLLRVTLSDPRLVTLPDPRNGASQAGTQASDKQQQTRKETKTNTLKMEGFSVDIYFNCCY